MKTKMNHLLGALLSLVVSFGLTHRAAAQTTPLPPCVDAPAGLVSWWRAEGDALDSVGPHHATLQNGASFGPGPVGQAFRFDGADDCADLGNWFNLQVFSIAMWVKAGAAQKTHADIIDNNHTDSRSWVIQYVNTGLRFAWGIAQRGGVLFDLTPDTWQFLVVTFDANYMGKLYLDGALVGSFNGGGPVVYDGAQFLRLSRWGGGGRQFNGLIDECDVYNRALSATEIQAIYNAGSAGKCPPPPPVCLEPPSGLAGWWRAEDDALDSVGGNHGTLQNGATFTSGRVGRAFSFNGVNQFVLVGDPVPPSLQIQNEITLSAWIYATTYPAGNTLGLIVGSQYDVQRAGATIFLDGRANPDGQPAPPGHIHFQIGDGSWHTANANAQVPLNQWVHIAATRRANEDAKVYYNGVLQPSTSLPWSGTISYSGAGFAIGQQKDINRPFNGRIDECDVYNRALSATEIQAIHAAGSAGKCVEQCVAPIITTEPVSQNVCPGRTASFTALASGTAPLSYQWSKDGADMSGATAATLTISSASTASAGSYRVRVSNACGQIESAAANLVVADVAPVINLHGAASVTVEACTGTYTELGATALDDCDGALPVIIGGDTVSTAQPGTFVVTYSATDSAIHTTTAIRVVSVHDTQPPVFTTVPSDLTVACGAGNQAAIDAWLASAAATDSCSPPVAITRAIQWLDVCGSGHALVTWTATDARGRARTASANLTVQPDGLLTSLQFVDDEASITMPRDVTQQIHVTVRNSGSCPVVIQSAQIAANFATPTLSVASPLPVTVCSGADATITLQVNSATTLDGTYAATLTLQGPTSGSISLPVRIIVSGRLWPDVALDFTGGGVSVQPASSPVFPVVGEAFTIHASVRNVGAIAAGAFTLKFFEGASLLGTQSVSGLGASQAANVSLNIPNGFAEGFYLIRAEATSPEGGELRVDNNSSSALLQVGVPFTADAFIRVTASLTPACTANSGTLSVHAEYVIVTEQAVLTHPVQGGRVDAIIQGTSHGVNNGHTDRDGNLSASIGLPPGGNYTLHVAVTDFTITGEEHLPITVPSTPNCAQGGVPQQVGNASPYYPPPEVADLYVCSSDLMFFAADGVTPITAPPQPGQTVYLCANVHYYTSGGLPLNSQPIHFKARRQLSLAAEDYFIGTTLANFAGGGATTVCVPWRVPETGTYVVTVTLAPAIQQLVDNDTTTRALLVGNPQPPVTAIRVAAEGAGCSPGNQWVSGRATYQHAGALLQPVVCGQVTVHAYDQNGVLLGTRGGPTTDSAGNFYFSPRIALPVGANRIVVEVTDGTLTGSTEFNIDCAASQNVPAPSTPPAAHGDLYLFSEHIAFLASDCVGSRSRNPIPGETISVAADIHYFDNYSGVPVSAVPVDINVLIPIGDALQSFRIATTTVDFPFGGGSSVICSPWTPTVIGPQIIQVVINSPSASLPFADYEGNNSATRLIVVGLQDLVLTAEPAVRHVLPGQSANYTINGEVLSADHPTLNLSAHLDATTASPGLAYVFGANSMTLPGNTSLTLSTTTATPPGAYQLYVVGSGDQRSAVVRVTLIVDSDTTAPTLTLLGENPMTVECHGNFTDPGATALDETDGDLTANIIVTGSVDVNVPGTHTLSYKVTDAAGNSAQTARTVTVADTQTPVPNVASLPTVTAQCSATVTAPTATDICDGLITATTGDPLHYTSPGTFTVHWTYTDSHGNNVLQSQSVIVQDTTLPVITLNGAASVTVECHSAYADAGATATDTCDGNLTSAIVTSNPVNIGTPGVYTVTYDVSDAAGNAALQVARTVTVINTAPVITSITGPSGPLALGSSTSVTVNFTEAEAQGHRCRFSWDDGSPDTEVVQPAGVGSASTSHTYAAAGVYTVTVTVADDCGATDTQTFQYIVIYDSNGGFVTGGGWITSPAGAYPADPSLTGKANFGFVSKYKNGAFVPEGQTEFQFHAGNFNFHSTAYEWLVVSGPKAQYKGTGTVNGGGSYKFLLTATDGQVNGGGDIDKFRLKITTTDGVVVYDNVLSAPDDLDQASPQAITGGSIVIHK